MDAQLVFGAVGAAVVVGSAIVAVAVHAATTRTMAETTAKDVTEHDHKLRNFDNWRLNILPTDLNTNFVRKDAIAPKLEAIDAALKRIEAHQEMMAQRFMNGGAGV